MTVSGRYAEALKNWRPGYRLCLPRSRLCGAYKNACIFVMQAFLVLSDDIPWRSQGVKWAYSNVIAVTDIGASLTSSFPFCTGISLKTAGLTVSGASKVLCEFMAVPVRYEPVAL